MGWRFALWFALSMHKPQLVILLLLLFGALLDPVFRRHGAIDGH